MLLHPLIELRQEVASEGCPAVSSSQRTAQSVASIALKPSLKGPQMNPEHGSNLLLASLPSIIGRDCPFPYLLSSYPCHIHFIGNTTSQT
jgi:hypothetical protein